MSTPTSTPPESHDATHSDAARRATGRRPSYGGRFGPGSRPVLLVVGMVTVFYGLLVMSLRPVAIATIAVLAAFALLIAGVAQLLLGLWAVGAPGREVLLLVNVIGIFLVLTGVDSIFGAFAGRSARRP